MQSVRAKRSLKVLCCHPTGLMYTEIYLRLEPLGVELVAAAARQAGHQVRILDLQVFSHADYFKILEDWAGLRPGTPDKLPILGATTTSGYCVATGHFRDGILLAPITAQVMADVIEGRGPEYDLAPFSPQRF